MKKNRGVSPKPGSDEIRTGDLKVHLRQHRKPQVRSTPRLAARRKGRSW